MNGFIKHFIHPFKSINELKLLQRLSYAFLVSFIILSLLFTQGCAVMSSEFDCNKVGGIKSCVSLSEVNRMTEDGRITENGVQRANNSGLIDQSSHNATQVNEINKKMISSQLPKSSILGQPVRVGERVQKMIVFPYEDSVGNYHESSVIYSILTPSHWLNYPVSQVKKQEI